MNVPVNIPHREMYWNIASPYKYFIYPLAVIALAFFIYGFYKRYKFWREGQPDTTRFGNWGSRIKLFLVETLFQTRVLKDTTAGLMHVLIFWSFLALLFTTTIVFLDVDFQIHIYRGPFYLFITILADIAGLALFIGLIIAACRRYVIKNDRLDNEWDDAYSLVLLGLFIITGFFLEGLRIAQTGDQWAAWSPIGYIISLGMDGWRDSAAIVAYQIVWWIHFALIFTFIATIPYTKFFHIFILPINILFSSLEPKGSMTRPDIEAMMENEDEDEEFNVGISNVDHLTWKQRLDLDACIRCGRCQEVCPAYNNQKPLNPKELILDLKTFIEVKLSIVNGNGETENEEIPLVVGGAFSSEPIWECRTCRACMEECPAHIEHIPLITELRRGEVLMRGELPTEASQALVTMERGGNPFGPQETRMEWIREAGFPVISEGEECEALFYIGCCTTYDLLKQKIAVDTINILKKAGVNVGVLGDDEICCGDPAKLFGEENLFQTAVKSQIETIKTRKFKYLVTHCPHCYNNFKNEYPQFTDTFDVVHHTELISRLIMSGKIKLPNAINNKITYHDPCYLGRYNDIYDEPRNILKSIQGIELVEMKNIRERSLCCGGGGGHYWMDIETGERINVTRVNEALDTGADIIAVSCIYCHHMINDAIKILDLEGKIVVRDISELVITAMGND